MMMTPEDLLREASATGFQPDVLEKAIRLLDLIDTLRSHPFLKTRIALKGGTAINLFGKSVTRLSVDIDLNYIGGATKETMLSDKPNVEKAVADACRRSQFTVKKTPTEHAGGKYRLSYTSAGGRTGTIELDVNFLLRTPLWPAMTRVSQSIGHKQAHEVLVLDDHELMAGKLAALFARGASRDLYDAREQLGRLALDRSKLRIGFVVYGGINRKDWRTISIDDVSTTTADVDSMLLPVLRADMKPRREGLESWTKQLISACRERLSVVLPLSKNEVEFIEALNARGEIAPQLLTDDATLRENIGNHPGLKWKALNVKKHFTGKMGEQEF